ncbi:MAG: PPC domain-containing DNA-binding protein [Candidatus Sericytochromatia bacterium]|nr:PPC domain-containing DNA-binding protein [Candidatus Sericytochromatia bacterium]
MSLLVAAGPAAQARVASPDAQLAPRSAGAAEAVRAQALRWGPGVDLRKALQAWAREHGGAWAITTVVGSLARASVRCAGKEAYSDWPGPLEIVSLTGTLAAEGCHLHVALADSAGTTRGGHLGDGAIVLTTAEVVLVELVGLGFARVLDSCTGYRELTIEPRPPGRPPQPGSGH